MKNIFLFIIILIFFNLCTASEDKDDSRPDEKNKLNLTQELKTTGNEVYLTTADGLTIKGVVVDTDGDGIGDGLDFNADNESDVIYISGTLDSNNKLHSSRVTSNEDYIAFRFVGDDTTFFFRALSEAVAIFSDMEGKSTEVTLVVEDSSIIGISTDGSESANVVFENPISVSDFPLPQLLSISPLDNSKIGQSDNIIITFNMAIDSSTITAEGTLGVEASWELSNQGGVDNDTIIFSPISVWSGGNDKTLIINGNSAEHNLSFSEISLSFHVDITGPVLLSSSPVALNYLVPSDSVILVFDESLDTSFFSATGEIPSRATFTYGFSSTDFENDTVTVTPDVPWYNESECIHSEGFDYSVQDIFGNITNGTLTLEISACT
jgi:hypothetical protein